MSHSEDAEAALHIVTDDNDGEQKYIISSEEVEEVEGGQQLQRMRTVSGKELMQLDLLNFTLVRCEDGEAGNSQGHYRLMTTQNAEGDGGELITGDQVTCVLRSDSEEGSKHEGAGGQYVTVMEGGEQGPLVIMQYDQGSEPEDQKSEVDVIAGVINKIRSQMKAKGHIVAKSPKPKKRRTELPTPHEMLSSPNFKLFLYNCKQCSYQCNAIKDLREHRQEAHKGGSSRWKNSAQPSRTPQIRLQCEQCPFRAATNAQLMRHIEFTHDEDQKIVVPVEQPTSSKQHKEDKAGPAVHMVDFLVCGACGFESSNKSIFKMHVQEKHVKNEKHILPEKQVQEKLREAARGSKRPADKSN